MKKINILVICIIFILSTGCKKFLDVNENPNGPSSADPALYLPSIQTGFASGIQFDARLIAPYIQNFLRLEAGQTYNVHGYIRSSDFGGELWRNVYWRGGQNITDVIKASRSQKKWDILGTGLVLRAWGWQNLTDYHGEIVVTEAFDSSKNTFKYDKEEVVYAEVKRLLNESITELSKSSDGVGSSLFKRFDLMYKGDRTKWMKFAYGILAVNAHNLSKKASYNPDSVIFFVDRAFASNADDAIVPFEGLTTSDANFFGTKRNNMGGYGQSAFIVRIMDSAVFTGAPDPRRLIMLAPSLDGKFRGLNPVTGQSTTLANAPTGVRNIWGLPLGFGAPVGSQGRYLFQDNAGFPLMTYSMLQFIKAEAAFIKGDKVMALAAYKNAINAHMDFVQNGMTAPGATTSGGTFKFNNDATINTAFNTEKTAFLANTNVIPVSANDLTQSMILLQKYIALWGYGFIETWNDLRKQDYDGTVFTSFALPSIFFPDNSNKPAYRVRPRYNSEYVWNIDALTEIGGFEPDFHTKKPWMFQP